MGGVVKVRRIGFVGTYTTSCEPTAAFFHDVLACQPFLAKPDWLIPKLPSGPHDSIKVYGPTKRDTNLFPDSAAGPVVAFIVDDVVSARAEGAVAGIELLGDLVWAGDGFGWFFLRAPDRTFYCIDRAPE
jgi:hypothetical protein